MSEFQDDEEFRDYVVDTVMQNGTGLDVVRKLCEAFGVQRIRAALIAVRADITAQDARSKAQVYTHSKKRGTHLHWRASAKQVEGKCIAAIVQTKVILKEQGEQRQARAEAKRNGALFKENGWGDVAVGARVLWPGAGVGSVVGLADRAVFVVWDELPGVPLPYHKPWDLPLEVLA